MTPLAGKAAVLLVADHYNDFEFWYPYYRLQEAGAEVIVAGPEAGTFASKYGVPAKAAKAYAEVDPGAAHGLVVPGGYAPDIMRRHQAALDLVRAMDCASKTIGFICHAGWLLVSAGVLKGRTVTSFFAIKDDMVNAGALWQDQAVVVDRNMVSSRTPDDLPAFMPAVIANMAA